MATHAVTLRLRSLIAEVHDGNLREAARHANIPYATLREIYRGDTVSPGLETVALLAGAYGIPVGWFLGESGEARPTPGWVGILPPDPDTGGDPRRARRVVIPFGAWSFVSVAVRLERRIAAMPPSPHRPIVGGATEEFDIRRRLTAFLLQPLLAARAAGAPRPLPAEPPIQGEPVFSPARRESWLNLLRSLGAFWERALAGWLE